jgi:hypothetical protein
MLLGAVRAVLEAPADAGSDPRAPSHAAVEVGPLLEAAQRRPQGALQLLAVPGDQALGREHVTDAAGEANQRTLVALPEQSAALRAGELRGGALERQLGSGELVLLPPFPLRRGLLPAVRDGLLQQPPDQRRHRLGREDAVHARDSRGVHGHVGV